jgi:hypothetical protein
MEGIKAACRRRFFTFI